MNTFLQLNLVKEVSNTKLKFQILKEKFYGNEHYPRNKLNNTSSKKLDKHS